MSLLAIIPARGGSKGIPRKNIKYLDGKPLIAWTVEAARSSSCIDHLVVSTDDHEIAQVAKELGVDVPFLRPTELATDDAPGIAPVIHAVSSLRGYEWVLLLQPTSPFRSSDDIDGIWRFSQEKSAVSAVSVSVAAKHPYWTYKLDDRQRLTPFINERTDITTRQKLPVPYALNGALYLARVDWLLRENTFVGEETIAYIMPEERSIDLDSMQDWKWAEFLISNAKMR